MSWQSADVDTNGIRVHYLRTGGNKPPIVLLHGLGGGGAVWTPIARALESEFDVVMPDARGHGRSSTPLHGYRYDDLAADTESLIRALRLARPVVVGHSMGGMTAATLASRRSAYLRGLVLVDPTFLTPERQREVRDSDAADQHRKALGLTKEALVAERTGRHPHRSAEIIDLLADAVLATRMAAWDVLTPPTPDYRNIASVFDVPSLLVIGDTPVVTPEVANELRRINSRLRVEQIANAGHGVPYDQPDRLAELIAAFARSLP
ncbi:MAG TPA: alpha/beta hydrolase [Kofleriaceae bacterium]